MATTMTELKAHLDSLGIKYAPNEENENEVAIPMGIPVEGEVEEILSVMQLLDDGQNFRIQSIDLVPREWIQKSNKDQLCQFMMTMLHLGWQTKYGTVEMDTDGEFRFSVEIPLADNTLTQAQLEMAIQGMVVSSVNIKKIARETFGISEAEEEPDEAEQTLLAIKQAAIQSALGALQSPAAPKEIKEAAKALLKDILETDSGIMTEEGKKAIQAALAFSSVQM